MLNHDHPSEIHHRRWDIPRIRRGQRSRKLSPSELFVASFFGLILVGTLGFMVLPGLYVQQRMGFVDSLFMATSAICITGLVTVDPATQFTFWGQLYLLVMAQIGGLGMLTFASFIITQLGGRPSLRSETLMASTPESLDHIPPRLLLLDVLRFTFFCEACGAIALFLIWGPEVGWSEAVWPAIFHSITAFCNTGFSTYPDSMMQYAHSTSTLGVLSVLIILGGIGFLTVEELYLLYVKRDPGIRRLSVHTKMVLWGAAILLIAPVAAFAIFEWERTLKDFSFQDKLSNAFFLSVTPRSCGFNAIDYSQASDSTNLLTMLLMMIGGSPGSTAGGIKTTTFMLLVLLAWTKLRGRPFVSFGDRSIPNKTVNHATGLFVIMTAITIGSVLMLQLLDDPFSEKDYQFLHRGFEVVSAVNTVGLSMGITEQLPMAAKLGLVLVMFVGRVGPISLFAAFESRFAERVDFRMAQEDVIVG